MPPAERNTPNPRDRTRDQSSDDSRRDSGGRSYARGQAGSRRKSRWRRREEQAERELEGTEAVVRTRAEREADLANARVVPSKSIHPDRVDPDALRVVSRLAKRGFEAYLVGGCVRDLLLGHEPKDFDVATEAHPRQIKRLFRNGRIIGRRFKLVHVVYGPHIIETSTFRADPPERDAASEDLLITDDNVFGTAAEDARRRDFTMNGLFFDPIEGRIIDFVDGLADLDSGLVRTIGDPNVRMAEDPVRILRAIKFATRLDLEIDDSTWDAMCDSAPELARSAPARVVEEILRLLRSGHASESFQLLEDCGALEVLLPQLDAWLADPPGDRDPEQLWSLLDRMDERIQRGEDLETGECLARLMAPTFLDRLEQLGRGTDPEGRKTPADRDALELADELLTRLSSVSRLSRRDMGTAKRLLANQPRFEQASSKRFRPLLFVKSPDFEASLELLRDRLAAGEDLAATVEEWEQRRREAAELEPDELARLKPKRRRRRSSKKRKTAAPPD